MMIPALTQPPSTPSDPRRAAGDEPRFPLRAARACSCCGTPLPTGLGRELPMFGVLGPKCALKFAPLLVALERAQQLVAVNDGSDAWNAACRVCLRLRGLGFEVTVVTHEDGGKSMQVGRLTRPAGAVVRSWTKVREEFEQRLQQAGAAA